MKIETSENTRSPLGLASLNGHHIDQVEGGSNALIFLPAEFPSPEALAAFAVLERYPTNPEWEVKDIGYDPEKQRWLEVKHYKSNGEIGLRASLAPRETAKHHPLVLKAGFYEKLYPLPGEGTKTPSRVAELVDIPYFLDVGIKIDGEPFDIDTLHAQNRLLYLEQTTDLEHGFYTYIVRWATTDGKITSAKIKRTANQRYKDLVSVECSIYPENYSGIVELTPGVDGDVSNPGPVPDTGIKYIKGTARRFDGASINYTGQTQYQRENTLALTSAIDLAVNGLAVDFSPQVDDTLLEKAYQTVKIQVTRGKVYTLNNLICHRASTDYDTSGNPREESLRRVYEQTYAQALDEHVQAWQRIWERADIKVTGRDPELQKRIRFNIALTQTFGNEENDRNSAGARALSAEAYKGHVFWDTDVYLQDLIHTNPEQFKKFLLYRYKRLPAAREKARKMGYTGACFPWESADTGEEATPGSVLGSKGETIYIHTGEREQHVTADVAYATWQYWLGTHDIEFMREAGAEIITETARFWASRVEKNAQGRYDIKNVIGPNEYTECADNDSFTNLMAIWNLELGRKVAEMFANDPAVLTKMGLAGESAQQELAQWQEVAENITLLFDEETRIYEDCAGFHNRKMFDFSQYPGNHAIDLLIRSWRREDGSPDHPQFYQVMKQQGNYVLFGALHGFPPDMETYRANFKHYRAGIRGALGSSLGFCMEAMAAHIAGEDANEVVFPLVEQALSVDSSNLMGNTGDGVHLAATGGNLWMTRRIWLGVINTEDGIFIDPAPLPDKLDSVEIQHMTHGQPMRIYKNREYIDFTLASLPVEIDPVATADGKVHNLVSGGSYRYFFGEHRWTNLNSPGTA